MTMIYQIRYTVVKSSLEEMKMNDLSVQPADTGAPPTYPYHSSIITIFPPEFYIKELFVT